MISFRFKIFTIFVLLFSSIQIFAQKKYPQNYFRLPLNIPIKLAGTFGELRPNHFHSGLDIKTDGRVGLKVYAAGDGYVYRIKKSPWGYGNVLYLRHPNGYTTIYGHLSRFRNDIAAYVEKQEYKQQSFNIDLFPPDTLFKVKKGDLIAYSGESGDAAGPHVHFEIRNTETDTPLNPLLFGFKIADDVPPIIQAINVYALNDSSSVNGKKMINLAVHGSSGNYLLSSNKTIDVRGEIGFAVKCYDKFTGVYNHVGTYSVQLFVDGKKVFGTAINSVKLANERAINSLIDYPMYLKYHSRYRKSFIDPGNPLKIYTAKNRNQSGRILINDDNTHIITYKISDYSGNVSQLVFRVDGNQKLGFPPENKPEIQKNVAYRRMRFNQSNTFMEKGILVQIPDGTLFTDINFYCKKADTITNAFAPLYKVGSSDIPLLKAITIGIESDKIPADLKNKAVVVREWGRNSVWGMKSKWVGKYLETNVKYFGNYTVKIDTTAPSIKPIDIYNGKNMSRNSGILLKISDNMTGIASYDMYVDGKWVLTQYLRHKRAIYYHFDNHVPKGKHHLKAIVKDEVGNVAVYEANFTR